MQLSFEEGRVVGSLIEKQLTTPQQYPLTLNALVAACNQTSNRDPVVSYDERTLHDTLAALKSAGLVRFVHPSHGRSVIRYRQVLEEKLGLSEEQLGLVGVLLLRGAQTIGELRTRTERMAQLDTIAAVEAELERLSARDEPLVRRVARRPGQKEERWAQLLAAESGEERPLGRGPDPADGGAAELAELAERPGGQASSASDLSEQVAALRAEVAELRAALEDLQEQLGV